MSEGADFAGSRRARTAIGGVPVLVALAIVAVIGTALWFAGGETRYVAYWQIQADAFRDMNRSLSAWPVPWSGLTELGDALVLLLLLAPLLLVRPAAWAAMLCAVPVATLLSRAGKTLVPVPRPAAVLDPQSFVVIGDTLSGYNSFPSGHATTVIVAGTVLVMTLRRERASRRRSLLTACLIAVVAAAAISRVAVGAHWPLDVLAGAVCGYLSGTSGLAFAGRYPACWNWTLTPLGRCRAGHVVLVPSVALGLDLYERSPIASPLAVYALIVGLAISFHLIASRWLIAPAGVPSPP